MIEWVGIWVEIQCSLTSALPLNHYCDHDCAAFVSGIFWVHCPVGGRVEMRRTCLFVSNLNFGEKKKLHWMKVCMRKACVVLHIHILVFLGGFCIVWLLSSVHHMDTAFFSFLPHYIEHKCHTQMNSDFRDKMTVNVVYYMENREIILFLLCCIKINRLINEIRGLQNKYTL